MVTKKKSAPKSSPSEARVQRQIEALKRQLAGQKGELEEIRRHALSTNQALEEAIERNATLRGSLVDRGISLPHLYRARDQMIAALAVVDSVIDLALSQQQPGEKL